MRPGALPHHSDVASRGVDRHARNGSRRPASSGRAAVPVPGRRGRPRRGHGHRGRLRRPGSPSTTAPVSTRAPVADRSEARGGELAGGQGPEAFPVAETAALPLAAADTAARTVERSRGLVPGSPAQSDRPAAARRDRTYLGWMTPKSATSRPDSTTTPARVLTTATLMTRFKVDDHNNPVVVVRPDGRLMAFWSGHLGARIYYQVCTTQPEVDEAWGPTRILPVQTRRGQQATPTPTRSSPRPRVTGCTCSRAPGWQPAYSTSGDLWRGPGRRRARSSSMLASSRVRARNSSRNPERADAPGVHRRTPPRDRRRQHPLRPEVKDDHARPARTAPVIGSVQAGPIRPNQADTVCSSQAQWAGQKAWVHNVAVDPGRAPR